MADADKPTARAKARDRRAQAHDPALARVACGHVAELLSHRFGTALPAMVLAGYSPIGDECDPLPAMAAHTGRLCLPVVRGKGLALEFRQWDFGTPLVQAAFGVAIPAQDVALVPDILIVPLLAFDVQGYRLGYGGGFYDRTLAALRAVRPVFALGLAYSAQQVPAVPRDATDAALDAIVTENGTIWPRA